MIRRVSAGLVAGMFAVAAAAAGQTPSRDARAPDAGPVGTARISGVVTTADSSLRPLRFAYVVIIGTATGTLRVTASDANGRFTFAGLAADRYLIGASKPPYLGAVAGARRPARAGTPVVLSEGQTLENVAIRLPLGAAIAGTIADERGQPAANVPVAIQQRRLQNGERTFVTVPGGTAATDERGRYRIFGLPPGEYIVGATPFTSGPAARALTDAEVDAAIKGTLPVPAAAPANTPPRYAPVFFPGTPRASDAAPIVLTAGEERQGMDFRLELARSVRVEGVVTTSDGQPTGGAAVVMTPATQNTLQRVASGTQAAADGRFSIANVPPGSYTLTARAIGPQANGQFAVMSIEVAGADQTGVQLMLRPPLTFSGRIAFRGDTAVPSLAGRRLTLRNLTSTSPGAAPQVGLTTADGAFNVTGVIPGRYTIAGSVFFGATSDSVTWAVESVMLEGRDVTDLPIDITADSVPKDFVVTFSDRQQQVAGRLLESSGAAAVDYTIVLFPSNRSYWIQGSRRILTARPGSDGQFVFGGPGPTALPAGEYLLAVVTDLERDEQFDPAFLTSLVPAATPVSLQAGARSVQEIHIR